MCVPHRAVARAGDGRNSLSTHPETPETPTEFASSTNTALRVVSGDCGTCMVPSGRADDAIRVDVNLCSSDEEPDTRAPAARAEPAAARAVPLSQRRTPRATGKPGLLMHQATANGTARRVPGKQAARKQAAARAAASKSAVSASSTAAGSRGAVSASSSSGHRGEVNAHEIVDKRIEVWWDEDEEWCAARQGSTHATEMPP